MRLINSYRVVGITCSHGDGVADVTSVVVPLRQVDNKDRFFIHFNNGSMPPFIGSPPLHLLSLNFHNLLCTSHSSPLSSGSNQGFRSNANLSGATTASTKTFLTALVLNSIIATVEISIFTLVRRYFRLIYEPRSLSVFESCACTFVLW